MDRPGERAAALARVAALVAGLAEARAAELLAEVDRLAGLGERLLALMVRRGRRPELVAAARRLTRQGERLLAELDGLG